jgi:hypothetical protein
LNHIAVANISQFGGRFREEPIYVGNHIPPHFRKVPELMDRFISTIHENWFNWRPTELGAYVRSAILSENPTAPASSSSENRVGGLNASAERSNDRGSRASFCLTRKFLGWRETRLH